MNWIKKSKFATYVLFIIAFVLSISSMIIAIYSDMGTSEFSTFVNLINKEKTPGFAIIGIIIFLFIFYIIAQLFFGAVISYLIARFIFRISIDFKTFYRITLIFNSLMSLVVIWQLFILKNSSNFLLVVANPILILSFIVMFWLLKELADKSWLKPLLFTIFALTSYLVFSSIPLGG